jgi:amino acid transporter
MVLADDGLFPLLFQRRHPRFGTPVVSLLVTGLVVTALCGVSLTKLVGAAALVQSLAYLLIYAAFFRIRRSHPASDPRAFHIPLGTGALMVMVAPSVVLVALVVSEGLWSNGRLDGAQALFDGAIVASGPLTYVLARRGARSRAAVAV